MNALLFRPCWEVATKYMAFWMRELEPKLKFMGVETVALDGADCVRANLETELNKKPTIAILGGHGRADLLAGDLNEVVLAACSNDQLLNGVHSILVSCQTGKQLGFSIISKGGAGYVGFNQDLVWIIGENEDPATEPWHVPLMEAIHAIALAYAAAVQRGDPSPAKAAAEAGIAKFDEEIAKWSYSGDPMAPEVVHWLIWDKFALVGLAEGEVVRAAPPVVPLLLAAAGAAAALWYFSRGEKGG